jgi:hypothetical protein
MIDWSDTIVEGKPDYPVDHSVPNSGATYDRDPIDYQNMHIVESDEATSLLDARANPMVSSVNSCSIGISWMPPNDGIGVTGYNIYRDGIYVGTTDEVLGSSNIIEFLYNDNSDLNSETSYIYRVSALDENGDDLQEIR